MLRFIHIYRLLITLTFIINVHKPLYTQINGSQIIGEWEVENKSVIKVIRFHDDGTFLAYYASTNLFPISNYSYQEYRALNGEYRIENDMLELSQIATSDNDPLVSNIQYNILNIAQDELLLEKSNEKQYNTLGVDSAKIRFTRAEIGIDVYNNLMSVLSDSLPGWFVWRWKDEINLAVDNVNFFKAGFVSSRGDYWDPGYIMLSIKFTEITQDRVNALNQHNEMAWEEIELIADTCKLCWTKDKFTNCMSTLERHFEKLGPEPIKSINSKQILVTRLRARYLYGWLHYLGNVRKLKSDKREMILSIINMQIP